MPRLELTRRGFLRGAAALTFGFGAGPSRLLAAAEASAVFAPSAILRIEADDTVRIFMPHADLGNGIYTGLAQVLAD